MISFAALYAVLSLVSLFPIIGAYGTFITLASIMAPLVGLMLGPYIGAGAVSLGGFIGWSLTQTGAFGFLSFLPGAFTAFASGLLANGKRMQAIALYVALFSILAFYPAIGPVWLYPYYIWFQLIGLVVLASPLTSFAINSARDKGNLARLSLGVGVLCLISTLLGQITGNLMFEVTRWPTVYPQVEFWRTAQWQFLTLVYPVERLIITGIATVVGTPMIKAVRANGVGSGGK
jgi:hypothetical protein